MVNVTNGAYVHMRLISFKLFFCHLSVSSAGVYFYLLIG
jgi:hypothetical protein